MRRAKALCTLRRQQSWSHGAIVSLRTTRTNVSRESLVHVATPSVLESRRDSFLRRTRTNTPRESKPHVRCGAGSPWSRRNGFLRGGTAQLSVGSQLSWFLSVGRVR